MQLTKLLPNGNGEVEVFQCSKCCPSGMRKSKPPNVPTSKVLSGVIAIQLTKSCDSDDGS